MLKRAMVLDNIRKYFSLNLFYKIAGLILGVCAGVYTLVQFSRYAFFPQNISCTYLTLALLPVAAFLFLRGTHKYRLDKRRSVDGSEREAVLSEARRLFLSSIAENTPPLSMAKKAPLIRELHRIDKKEICLELDLLPLRQILTDYSLDWDLPAKARYNLAILEEYNESEDSRNYEDTKNRIEKLIEDIEGGSKTEVDQTKANRLRAEIKSILETVGFYDLAWAEGEAIFKGVLYWVALSAISLILIGILPLTHSQGSNFLNILHWGVLGVSGALLSVLTVHEQNFLELGETRGKEILQRTIVGVVLGFISAILLYSALQGQIVSGKMFPDLAEVPTEIGSVKYWWYIGGSIFWSILAGFSLRIFSGLANFAESSFGNTSSS